jgi:hypothetical protein
MLSDIAIILATLVIFASIAMLSFINVNDIK